MLGVGFLRAARENHLRVPQTMSVIALHNADIAEFTNPSLTTVALPMEEMGRVAADLLIDVIEGAAPAHKQVTTAPVLVLRESTAPPRAGSGT